MNMKRIHFFVLQSLVGAADPSTGVTTPPSIDAMTDDMKAQAQGRTWGESIVAAEAGVVAAEMTREETKLETLKACATLGTFKARQSFILGVRGALEAKDGDKLLKGHSNFLSELARVNRFCGDDSARQNQALTILTGPGTLDKKIQAIPTEAPAANRGTGKKAEQAAVTQAVETLREKGLTVNAETVAAAVEQIVNAKAQAEHAAETPKPAETVKPAETQPDAEKPAETAKPTARTSQQPEHSVRALVQIVESMQENAIFPVAYALVKRAKLSTDPLAQSMADALEKILDSEDPAVVQARNATQQQPQPAPMAH